MTRRCQWCERLFTGDVCTHCGADHVIHVAVTEAERTCEHPEAKHCASLGTRPVPIYTTACEHCGGPMESRRRANPRRFCTRMCQRRAIASEVRAIRAQRVPRPVGRSQEPIGRPEYRPGSGRGTPHPKGAA